MSNPKLNDDALFEALGKKKKRRKRRIILIVVLVLLVIAVAAFFVVRYLQQQVRQRFAATSAEVLSYEATTGTISTVVSGAGTLSDVDLEIIDLPEGVEVEELLVARNDAVKEGDVLATLDMTSIVNAMSALQAKISELDAQIATAAEDEVDSEITAGVSGRVKAIYAEEGINVATCMVENGALVMLSLDGYMAVDVTAGSLNPGDVVTVRLSDGSELSGSVALAINGTATVLVTDNGPANGETVTVFSDNGIELGGGALYIHDPLGVTGFAGTVESILVDLDELVDGDDTLLRLTDTGYSVNYDSLLRSRNELEEELLELLALQRDGAILSPISGSVYAVADADETAEIITLSRDAQMSVTITVDESDIMSLELEQTAQVTVSSVSENAFSGTVTEIDTNGTSGSYSAVITLDKSEGMLSGMTASVEVIIQGVENAILIPVDALHLTSDGAYVYTAYDEEAQQYGGQVDVVVGLSNSSYVEIKSGLNEGDPVYYTQSQSFFGMFGGMGYFGGGMPGGSFDRGDMNGSDFGGFGGFGGEMPDMADGGFGGNMPNRGGGAGGNRGGFGGN